MSDEESVSDAQKNASDFCKLKSAFSQQYPKRRLLKIFFGGRFTVDKQEKDCVKSMMPYFARLLQTIY